MSVRGYVCEGFCCHTDGQTLTLSMNTDQSTVRGRQQLRRINIYDAIAKQCTTSAHPRITDFHFYACCGTRKPY